MAAVEAVLSSLRADGPFTTEDEAHGRLALTLAAELDAVAAGRRDTCRGDDGEVVVWTLASGSGTAALAKELRAALAAMDHGTHDDDDDLFGADLPAAVRHPEEP